MIQPWSSKNAACGTRLAHLRPLLHRSRWGANPYRYVVRTPVRDLVGGLEEGLRALSRAFRPTLRTQGVPCLRLRRKSEGRSVSGEGDGADEELRAVGKGNACISKTSQRVVSPGCLGKRRERSLASYYCKLATRRADSV